jgi:hypothetical protein
MTLFNHIKNQTNYFLHKNDENCIIYIGRYLLINNS